MKSAYEIAMEKLNKADPDHKPLSAEQKEKLVAIDEKYKAKLAEREIFLREKLLGAEQAGNHEEASMIRKQIHDEKMLLEEEMEAEKEKIRAG